MDQALPVVLIAVRLLIVAVAAVVIVGVVEAVTKMKWEPGRQKSGYSKLKLFGFGLLDVYLLKFPPGSYVPMHTDPVDGFNHHRLNLILRRAKLGGVKTIGKCGVVDRYEPRRIDYFRSDIQAHGQTRIDSDRTQYTLSIGWLTKCE